MQKIRVSVVIIAKNEEKKIKKCLDSVKWADETIVVDGLSADRTADIAASAGAKVIRHEFTGSFADDRNIGLNNAANDWVLQLDADDIVTDDFRDKLARRLPGDDGIAVYKFRRKNFFLGHAMDHGGFHHYIPNLVNRKSVKYEGDVHEVPVYSGRMATLEADVEHYPFDSIGQFIDRQNRYAGIAAKRLLDTEGVLAEPKIRNNMIFKSFKIFWKSYVRKQGYREGMYGFLFAVLFAFINFLKWAKYWELAREKK